MTSKNHWQALCATTLALLATTACITGDSSTPQSAVGQCFIDPMSSPYAIRQLRDNGGRVFWSPDGSELAFMEEGDAFVMTVRTGAERCLTCDFDTAGFERVQFLSDGSVLLIGPRNGAEAAIEDNLNLAGRALGAELWWMPADASRAPQSLGVQTFEGVAMSPTSNQIAWTWPGVPASLAEPLAAYGLWLGRVEVTPDGAAIVDRTLITSRFEIFEAQDIVDNGARILFTSYYNPERRFAPLDNPDGEVMTAHIDTGEVINHTNNTAYDEAEGFFHGADIDVIESGRDTGQGFGGQLDLYLLKLDSPNQPLRRLTYFADMEGVKANNPDVHPNGRQIAFSKGLIVNDGSEATAEDAGIFLLEFGCS